MKTYTQKEVDDLIFEALTVQAMQMHNEVFAMGGMNQDYFARQYCGNFGPYERKLAKREGIKVPPKKK